MRIATSRLLNRKVVAAMTGPDSGFQAAREWKDKSASKTLVCGTHGGSQALKNFGSLVMESGLNELLPFSILRFTI